MELTDLLLLVIYISPAGGSFVFAGHDNLHDYGYGRVPDRQ